jgi:DNA-binding MarR family transcriptional regulator
MSGPEDADALVDAVAELRARVAPLILARQERRAAGATEGERLTTPQQLTLRALADGPRAVSEVAAATGVAVSTATRMLQSLARSGWVEPAAPGAGGDRRRRPVRLTRAGRRVLGDAESALRARIRELLGRLDADERAAIVRGLAALARALQLDERSSDLPAAASSAVSSARTVGAGAGSGEAPSGRMPSRMTPR